MRNWRTRYQNQPKDLNLKSNYKTPGFSQTGSYYQGKASSSIQYMQKTPTYWRESRKANPTPNRFNKTPNYSNHPRMNKTYSKPANLNIGQSLNSFGKYYNQEKDYKKNPYSSTAQLSNSTLNLRRYTPLKKYEISRKKNSIQKEEIHIKSQEIEENNISRALNETDITYTNYSGNILCMRESNYTKRLHRDLKSETSSEKINRILKEHEEIIQNQSIRKKNFRNRESEIKYGDFSSKMRFERENIRRYRMENTEKSDEVSGTECSETIKYTTKGRRTESRTDTFTSETDNNLTPRSYKTSSVDTSDKMKITALNSRGKDKIPLARTSPFTYSVILDDDKLSEEDKDSDRTVKRSDNKKVFNDESAIKFGEFEHLDTIAEDKLFDENMEKFNNKLKFLENKLMEIEMGRTSRRMKRAKPTASSGDHFSQSHLHSEIKPRKVAGELKATFKPEYKEVIEFRRESVYKENIISTVEAIPSDNSPEVKKKEPLRDISRNYYPNSSVSSFHQTFSKGIGLRRNSLQKSSLKKRDSLQRDSLQRDSLQRDSLQRDSLQKSSLKKRDSLQRDSLQRDSLQRDSLQRSSLQRERDSLQRNSLQRSSLQRSSLKPRGSLQRDSLQKKKKNNSNLLPRPKIPKIPRKRSKIGLGDSLTQMKPLKENSEPQALRTIFTQSTQLENINLNSGLRKRSKYSGNCKKSAELQRSKDIEKYIQAANRSQNCSLKKEKTAKSVTPNKIPKTNSKYKLNQNLKSKSEFKPKRSKKGFAIRASKKNSPLPTTGRLEIEGQVSYLERIAKGHYTSKRVNHLSPFGQFLGDCKEQMILSRRCQQYLRSRPFKGKQVKFKRDFKKLKTILLDLDETLVHSEEYVEGNEYDIDVTVEHDDRKDKIGVYVRPYCKEFLELLSKEFELVIFTASREDYADLVIDKLDPEKNLITYRLYRQHCVNFEELYIKDLRLLSNRKKEDLIIVDNLIYSYANDIENGIPIRGYYQGKDDYELRYLCEMLLQLKSFMDCPTYIESQFNLSKFYNFL